MDDLTELFDTEKYRLEAKIYSADRKYEKIITDTEFLKKINQCEHLTALDHTTKEIILEVEKILLPLKPHAASLFLETKGGSVVSRMSLEDFFGLLDIGKRIEIYDRFEKTDPLTKEAASSIEKEISELLDKLDANK